MEKGLAVFGVFAFLFIWGCSPPIRPQEPGAAEIENSASIFGRGTCTASAIGDPYNGDIYCSMTRYCGLFRGTATLTSGPWDSPACHCECK